MRQTDCHSGAPPPAQGVAGGRRKRIRSLAGFGLLLVSFSAVADSLYTRELDCERQSSPRAKEICRALESALEWTWTGHAIISPSFRMGLEGMRRVYCTVPITPRDTGLLVEMEFDSDSRTGMRQVQINNGVRWLLSMLGKQALDHFPDIKQIADKRRRNRAQYLKKMIELDIDQRSSSIFNPSHRQYILRDGCPPG
jgi:hypothetical protein